MHLYAQRVQHNCAVFPTHGYKFTSNCHHSACTPPPAPPFFPSHPLHPLTSAVNGGVTGRSVGGVRGVRLMRVTVGAVGQRGTVCPLSPCEGDSGVSVFGLAGSPPSLPHFLALCPRSCFSLSLFVLANTRWHLAATRSAACARGPRTCIADTRAHPA